MQTFKNSDMNMYIFPALLNEQLGLLWDPPLAERAWRPCSPVTPSCGQLIWLHMIELVCIRPV